MHCVDALSQCKVLGSCPALFLRRRATFFPHFYVDLEMSTHLLNAHNDHSPVWGLAPFIPDFSYLLVM